MFPISLAWTGDLRFIGEMKTPWLDKHNLEKISADEGFNQTIFLRQTQVGLNWVLDYSLGLRQVFDTLSL